MHNFFDTEAVYTIFLQAYSATLDNFSGNTLAAMYLDARQARAAELACLIADVGIARFGTIGWLHLWQDWLTEGIKPC